MAGRRAESRAERPAGVDRTGAALNTCELGGYGRELGLEIEDAADALEVHADAGQLADAVQAGEVSVAVAAGPSGGGGGVEQPSALVEPEGLGMKSGRLRRDRQHRSPRQG